MEHYEYKVIPAPRHGVRVKGAKGTAGRFAGTLEVAINELSARGWEYVRAESLPVDERHGITRRKTETYQNVLIFRRLTGGLDKEPPITALIADQTDLDENLFDDTGEDVPEEEPDDTVKGTQKDDEADKEDEKA